MKTISFTYTKPDGTVSNRLLSVIIEPVADFYEGIDLSELDDATANEYMEAAQALHDAYIEVQQELRKAFDLTYSYKRFLCSRMSNISQTV